MDHTYAIQNHIAERYLLGELSDTERDAFEERSFRQPCAEAEEVKIAAQFVAAAARTALEEAPIPRDHARRQAKYEGFAKVKRTGPQRLSDPTTMNKRQRSGQRTHQDDRSAVSRRRNGVSPPADAEYLLKFIPENEEKLLHLKIEHSKMSHQYGYFKANVWYWFQAIRSIVPHVWPFIRKVVAVIAILGLIGK